MPRPDDVYMNLKEETCDMTSMGREASGLSRLVTASISGSGVGDKCCRSDSAAGLCAGGGALHNV